MDVLSDLLHRARARHTRVHQLIQRPPWSMAFAEPPALTVVAALDGPASVRLLEHPSAGPVPLASGDIALVRGSAGRYVLADGPGTAPQVLIRDGTKQVLDAGAVSERSLGPRTYGDGLPGATTLLHGAYGFRGAAGEHLLGLLPPLAVVPGREGSTAALRLLAAETARQEPGQEAVLNRLLDLVLVLALRAWCTRPDAELPSWPAALGVPAVGEAIRLLHAEPARRWTVAELAARVGRSRTVFAAQFTRAVGEPPLAHLTAWRMVLAADLLRDTEATVAAVARQVGYRDAFAFSTAFKRARGLTPSDWRVRHGS
ncbi:AraC family transcriptional regulator [Kitasatospora cineracea]|uniref:AraC-like DNA-binding protein n=1 Tax=Kitasatospora cineracea TaxID=88074 RepID=A0A3N4RUH5_9ACTN|nr:AraC family transcriptional regulator [Kitasatospora cineracea]ROR46849.1 AraC-like DNA-binding protein [Kitasatospora cineracea]RPE37012.1 AraC-like DNA-binding protein [Kitasatospora cineracea]